jgi:Cytotoxic
MPPVPRPDPCYLDDMEYLGAYGGQQRWRSTDGEFLYTWDATHGEIEVFNKRGYHRGVAHAVTGELIKPARKGRRIDV